ncbi:MAG: Fur family transcriptional regulator, partial [Anaerolineae bacterium]
MSLSDKMSPEKVLRAAGKRVTSQRLLVLEIITETDHHLTAEEVYRLAKERDSNISLATVYRNLQVLQELDLIEHRY